tara:strand:+ start:2535 stop:3167 length:633 start_codon:yes stop_codon:yes gene_type:complete
MLTKQQWHDQPYEIRKKQLDDTYTYYHTKATGHFQGSIFADITVIAGITKAGSYRTLLDYGSGESMMWSNFKPTHRNETFMARHLHRAGLTFEVTLYDPYSSKYNNLRLDQRHDIVMCNDVLEHVLIEDVAGTLDAIFSFANKAVYLNISTQYASKKITDLNGNIITEQDLHVTVKPAEWWLEQIDKAEMKLRDKEKRFVTVYTKFDKYV